jgi:hypothetical protein
VFTDPSLRSGPLFTGPLLIPVARQEPPSIDERLHAGPAPGEGLGQSLPCGCEEIAHAQFEIFSQTFVNVMEAEAVPPWPSEMV